MMKKIILFICCISVVGSPIKEASAINPLDWGSFFESFDKSVFWKTVIIIGVALSCIPLVEKVWMFYKHKTKKPDVDVKSYIENAKEISELKETIKVLQEQINAANQNDNDVQSSNGPKETHTSIARLKKKQKKLKTKILTEYMKQREFLELKTDLENFLAPIAHRLTLLNEGFIHKKFLVPIIHKLNLLSESMSEINMEFLHKTTELNDKVKNKIEKMENEINQFKQQLEKVPAPLALTEKEKKVN